MLKNLSENLIVLMAKARLNASELARLTGLQHTTIMRIRNNEQANPTITTLLPIAQYFSLTLSQLIGDEPLPRRRGIHGDTQEIPLLSWHACAQLSEAIDKPDAKRVITERQVSAKAFALVLENQELDGFPQNSLLIVDPEKMPHSGDYVIAINVERKVASLKKLIIEAEQTYLKPLIAGLAPCALTAAYEILGTVVQCKIDLKP
ncbi:MAG TPA: helix-turn-helix domain-containing protein [Gammaproteobacteria bacterium]|jgi:SOS-response transcriptional repressor LexA|nr:helix-turn-helix domain-containing protein [Gammaproteobacteria bacterium]